MYKGYYSSQVGILRITCNDEFVTGVHFTDDSEVRGSDKCCLLNNCINQLDAYFKGNLKEFDLPLAQPGTPFQQKVWNQLTTIPYGKTISYMAVSKLLGDVKAIRAVGTANGRNNIAIIVPCHRVIGSNAKLTGYAGGLWRKQWLLEHEAKFHQGLQLLF
jgi:methylated-DNA-[protein]-cysteine S-methyltransferase